MDGTIFPNVTFDDEDGAPPKLFKIEAVFRGDHVHTKWRAGAPGSRALLGSLIFRKDEWRALLETILYDAIEIEVLDDEEAE